MTASEDRLTERRQPDRVHYATGVLLNAADFSDEQNYHRGRLARALAYVAGRGTVAGLRVVHEAAVEADDDAGTPAREERLLIEPGLAIDRVGRMIEIAAPLCIRLDRWYRGEPAADVNDAFHGDPDNGVIADLFVRFVACERGKRPAFAEGAVASLDAVTASRVRDAAEAELVLRTEPDPPLPRSPWPDLAALPEAERPARLREALLDAWRESSDDSSVGDLDLLPEQLPGQDPTSVFLARIVVAAEPPAAGERPVRAAGSAVTVSNDSREFVYTANALARWLGL